MQKINMYWLAQLYSYNDDGYKIPIGKSHLVKPVSGRMSTTLCGKKISSMNLPRADIELKQWLIDLTACKKCKKVAEKQMKS